MRINICVSADDNYSKYAGVLIASVLANKADDDELHFYVLEDGITDENKEKILSLKKINDCIINFVTINRKDFKDYEAANTHEYITLATYYRLKLASMIPDVDKIIYFDCDMVVNSSLSELFAEDLGNNIVGGVMDIGYKRMNRKTGLPKNGVYVNAGMLVLNLKTWRKENIEEKFLNYTKENINDIFCGDQQIINVVAHERIKALPAKWNVQTSNFVNRSSYMKHPSVIHYVSRQKPWNYGCWNYHKKYYFEYLQLTPWALKEEEKFHWYVKSEIASIFGYIKYRPLFLVTPRFWAAVFKSYLCP